MPKLPIILSLLLCSCAVGWAGFGDELKSYGFGTSDILRDNKRDRVYCAVPAQNSVVVIDSESLEILDTVFTGSDPCALAESPDGSKLYIANQGTNIQGLAVLNLDSLVVSYIATSQPVYGVAASNDTVYTLEGGTLRAYNTANGMPLANFSGVSVYGGSLALSPDGGTLYYYQSGLSPSSWFRLNVASWPATVAQSGQYGSNGQGMALSADGRWITFASGSPYHVNKLDASNPSLNAGQFNTGAYPRAVTYSPDGTKLFATHTQGHVDVWNTNTYIQTSPITTPGEPRHLMCDRKGKVLFAGSESSLRAHQIGTTSNQDHLKLEISQAVEVSWNSIADRLYQIEWSANLAADAEWQPLGEPVLGNGLTMNAFDTTRNSRSKFYRIRAID